MNADDIIFRAPVPAMRSTDDWAAIVDHLVATFAATIGMSLTVDHRSVIDQQALTCRVMTAEPLGGPLCLGITATIGLEIINGKPMVDAVVFAFSNEVRLDIDHYACFKYREDGHWEYGGWIKDIYREFLSWPPPRYAS